MQSSSETPNFLRTSRHNPTFFDVSARLGEVVDYCVPANPYFPTPAMYDALVAALPNLLKYYPDHGPASVSILSQLTGTDPSHLIAANGSTEIITSLINGQMSGPMLTEIPTFGRWTDLPIDIGTCLVTFQRRAGQDFHVAPDELVAFAKRSGARSMVLCNPNNPTGALSRRDELLEIIERLAHLDLIVIDESFLPFADDPATDSLEKIAPGLANVIVVKSLGKALGWHGVRLGYAVANPDLIARLRPAVPYWNINGIAHFALRLVRDDPEEFATSLARVVTDRRYLEQRLSEIPGLRVFPTQANFAFFQIPQHLDGRDLRDRLATKHKLFVRECSNKIGSCSTFFRVAARPAADTDRLVAALMAELGRQSLCGDYRVCRKSPRSRPCLPSRRGRGGASSGVYPA
jgi:histidinol-phosphate/aromatic aminotransferase/cobyric acid decarboxylase-like protein